MSPNAWLWCSIMALVIWAIIAVILWLVFA